MFQVRRRGQVTYEDLLRELEAMEHQLLGENSSLAMSLMVLEAKIRDRFQKMDLQLQSKAPLSDDELFGENFTMDEIQALIPKELPEFPTIEQVGASRRRKRKLETIGMAAVLALVTALGVFGLASILQLALSWVA